MRSLREHSSAENIFPGDRVLVAGKRAGIVHFVGDTDFAPGTFKSPESFVGHIYAVLADVIYVYMKLYSSMTDSNNSLSTWV